MPATALAHLYKYTQKTMYNREGNHLVNNTFKYMPPVAFTMLIHPRWENININLTFWEKNAMLFVQLSNFRYKQCSEK